MTRKLQTRADFPVTAAAMLEIMTSPDLLDRQHRLQGALEVEVSENERSTERLVIEVSVREYWRNLKGSDESKVVDARTVYTWDLPGSSCRWRYRGARGEMVRISGSISLGPHGADGCRVLSEVAVTVPVPILGAVLERRIAAEIEAGFAPFEELLREFCRNK